MRRDLLNPLAQTTEQIQVGRDGLKMDMDGWKRPKKKKGQNRAQETISGVWALSPLRAP